MNDASQASVDTASAKKAGQHGVRLVAENLKDLSTHYLDRLALAWRRRNKQIASHHHDFNDLIDWDRRILTYLEALALLEPQACCQGLERLSEPLLDEELFALALLALRTRNKPLTQACISLVQGMPHFIEPYAAALAWVDWSACEANLNQWPNANEPYLRLHLTALSHHHVELSPQQIKNWVGSLSPQPQIGIATLRCGILRGEPEWALKANEWLKTDHSGLRLAAAEALIVLGPSRARRKMLPILRDLALDSSHPSVCEDAARKLLTVPCSEGQELLEALEVDPNRQRLYLEALGWTGEPAAIPLLSERMDDPQQARLAGAVIGALIGSHPVRDGWQAEARPETDHPGDTPDAEDALPPPDPDAGLPWPDRGRFSDWWQRQSDNWPVSQRYLGGRPRDNSELHAILHQGILAWRPQAAWHLQIVQRGRGLPWCAPAPHQKHHLVTYVETHHG